jgi:hypothetical protein
MDFLQTNSERTSGGRLRRYAFTAQVAYYYSSRTTTFTTEVTVDTGFDSGRVTMLENEQCPADEFHLDFRPKWQAMHFDRQSNILVISGKSEKMGPYKVSLSALIATAT